MKMTATGILVGPLFFVICVLLYAAMAIVSVEATTPTLYDGGTFGICVFWWSDVGDNGYTDAHQLGLSTALSVLTARYPAVTFTVSRAVNVAFATNKVSVYHDIFDNSVCSVVYFAFSDLYASHAWLINEATAHPNVLYAVGDLREWSSGLPRNVIVAEPICDREWFLAGALSAKLYNNLSIAMMISFENATGYSTHALAAGIRYVQQNLSQTTFTKPLIIPLEGWVQTDAETIASELAINNSHADVLTHFTDPFITSRVAHDNGKHSIGWGHDYSSYFLASILTSVIRVYNVQLETIFENWLFNVSQPRSVFACSLAAFSSDVPAPVVSYMQAINITLNMTAQVWSDAVYYNVLGEAVLFGPLSEFDVGTMTFVSNFSTLNRPFLGPAACSSNYAASYSTTPDYHTICTPCPEGYYSINGAACAPCTGVFASYCSSSPSSNKTTAIIIGVLVGVGGALLLFAFATTLYFKRRASRLRQEIQERRDPSVVLHSSQSTDGGASVSAVDASYVRDQIQRGEFCLGNAIPSSSQGATMYRCFLNQGGAVMVYEYNNRTEEEATRLAEFLPAVTDHPNLVRILMVRHDAERCTVQIFCENTSGGTLQDMLLDTKGKLTEQAAKAISLQILRGLSHLHKHQCAHRSLSVQNVFLTSSGLPKLFCSPLVAHLDNHATADASLTVVVSASFIAAPEVLTGAYDMQQDILTAACNADVWMFGVLVAQLLNSGNDPWPADVASSPSAVIAYILQGHGPVVPPSASDFAVDFVSSCTNPIASRRPSTDQLLASLWFSKGDASLTSTGGGSLRSSGTLSTSTGSTYHVVKLIGVGSFGTVHCVKMADGRELAMKTVTFDLEDESSVKRLKRAQQEYVTLSGLSHPNIVKYVALETDQPTATDSSMPIDRSSFSSRPTPRLCHFRIFMEYVRGGSVKQYLASMMGGGTVRNEALVIPIVSAMLRALAFAHSNKIVHRDVKPSNFLYCGPPDVVKLADFGSAAVISGQMTATYSIQGTLLFMAPEILREEVPTTAADIWSLGATVMDLVTGESPWTHVFPAGAPVMAVVAYVGSSEPLRLPQGISAKCQRFLERCLRREPAQRATATELLEDPWLIDAS